MKNLYKMFDILSILKKVLVDTAGWWMLQLELGPYYPTK